MTRSRVNLGGGAEEREVRYQRLRLAVDPASPLERGFLDFLYEQGLRLPDRAQHRPSGDIYVQPDFYYDDSHARVFVDGAVHAQASVQMDDRAKREALEDRGYRVITVGSDFEGAVRARPDIFELVESDDDRSARPGLGQAGSGVTVRYCDDQFRSPVCAPGECPSL